MALQIADRVWDTTTTAGTGVITLANSPPNGYQSFGSVCSTNDTIYYALAGRTANVWEVGLGTFNASGPTLTRTTVFASSNSGSAVTLAGTTDVMGVWPASKFNSISGDATMTGAGVLTIANGAVTLAKMANETANTILGNNTGSPAAPIALTASQVNTLLGIPTTVSNSDGTLTISPTTGAVVASLALGHANTWTAAQTFNSGDLKLAGATSGTTTLNAAAIAGTTTITLPAVTDTVAVLGTADQTVSGGANVTSASLTTGNVTIDCGKCPLQFITNGGAYTITAPANDGSCMLLVTNNASAGATTFSGFTVGSNTGDTLTTTNTSKFTISIWRINGTSGYRIAAHQ